MKSNCNHSDFVFEVRYTQPLRVGKKEITVYAICRKCGLGTPADVHINTFDCTKKTIKAISRAVVKRLKRLDEVVGSN